MIRKRYIRKSIAWMLILTFMQFFVVKSLHYHNDEPKKALGVKEVYLSEEIIENVLGTSYSVYRKLIDELSGYGIFPEWNYYNDYKSWL